MAGHRRHQEEPQKERKESKENVPGKSKEMKVTTIKPNPDPIGVKNRAYTVYFNHTLCFF